MHKNTLLCVYKTGTYVPKYWVFYTQINGYLDTTLEKSYVFWRIITLRGNAALRYNWLVKAMYYKVQIR